MYLEHYGLTEPPFSITPDPRFVFLSERHRDALAHLLFGIGQGGGGGFVQLTGEVGTGKTTLCRLLLEQLRQHEDSMPTRVALVLNPRQTPVELLQTICEELHLDLAQLDQDNQRGSVKALVDVLNAFLLQAHADGLRVVLVIDEAQNLSTDALEQVRLLTNLETDTQKLLQIVLLGQPELRDMLARDELRQLAQRITARFHLTPLDGAESAEYMRHRYRVGGGQRFPFGAAALRRVHAHSGGVPRLINVIAERALLAGYAHDAATIDARTVDRAAREALAPRRSRWSRPDLALAAAGVLALVLLAIWGRPSAPPAAQARAAAPAATTAAIAVEPVDRAPPALVDGDALAARIATTGASPAPAWERLLALWQVDATGEPAAGAACPPVLAPGLYCLHGRGRLDKLATLARPALLRLHGGEAEAWALLLGSDTGRVRLQLDEAVLEVDRNTLNRAWTGDFIALWRGPEFLAAPLAAPLPTDASGPATDWIRQRLGDEAQPGTALRAAVRRFQAARGLSADGVAGPETLMALAAGDDGPRLLREL